MRRESVRRRWFVSLCSSGRDTETVAAHSSSVLERRCACGCESPPRARRPSLRRQKRDARPQPGADGPRRSPRTYAPQDARDRSYLVSAYLVATGLPRRRRCPSPSAAPPIGQPSDRSIGAQRRLQIRERCWRRRRWSLVLLLVGPPRAIRPAATPQQSSAASSALRCAD